MIYNEGTIDRIIRIALGTLLVALSLMGQRTVWVAALGLVFMVTGFAGFCPLYRVFGVRTCKTPS